MDLGFVGEAARLGVELAPQGARQLESFEQLLRERGVRLGVVAPGDAGRLRERHMLDCLRAASAVEPADREAYDLGSGGGLPGIVVAVATPALSVTLVERRRSRLAFLELTVERLGLGNVRVAPCRIEELSEPVDICFARALAPLPRAWALARPLLRMGGRLVYFAGARGHAGEVPPGASMRVMEVRSGVVPLESAGPLVIMSQQ